MIRVQSSLASIQKSATTAFKLVHPQVPGTADQQDGKAKSSKLEAEATASEVDKFDFTSLSPTPISHAALVSSVPLILQTLVQQTSNSAFDQHRCCISQFFVDATGALAKLTKLGLSVGVWSGLVSTHHLSGAERAGYKID
jgi:hypothetical protein